jgi:hypothetical protein
MPAMLDCNGGYSAWLDVLDMLAMLSMLPGWLWLWSLIGCALYAALLPMLAIPPGYANMLFVSLTFL